MSSRPLVVVHVITGTGTGGAERSLWRLCAGEHDRPTPRVQHHVVALKPPGRLFAALSAVAPTTSLGWTRPGEAPQALWRLRRAVRRVRPDVLHGWLPQGNTAAYLAHRGLSRPPRLFWNVRGSAHGSDRRASTAWLSAATRWASQETDTIVFNAESVRDDYARRGFGGRHLVIDNGYDPARWPRLDEQARRAARGALGLDDHRPVVGFFGRRAAEKGSDIVAGLAARAGSLGVALLLVGEGFPHPDNDFPSVVQRPAVAAEELPALLGACDLTVLPSAHEGFPNAIAESLLCGVPVLCSHAGDSARVLGPGGVVVHPRTTEAFGRGLQAWFARPAAEREAIATRGRDHVVAHFDIRAMLESYRRAYGAGS